MPHYYSEKQPSDINLKKIKISVKNIEFELYTGSGVFSKNRLDKGTKILIENAIIKENWEVLDFGCGIGVIGISIKKLYPSIGVFMTDINERAINISKKNIEFHGLENVEVSKSNLYENIGDKFDTILVNPPQTAGKDLCFAIIQGSKKHLKKRALLQLVARHNKGGKTLRNKMKEVFGNVKDIVKSSGYRVYVSKN